MASQLDSSTGEPELTLAEAINLATRRMAAAVAIAGMAIGLGLWWKPSPARYQGFVTPDGVVRLNTKTGSIVLCEPGKKCALVLLESKDLKGGHSFDFGFSSKPPAVAPPKAPAPPAADAPAKAQTAPAPSP